MRCCLAPIFPLRPSTDGRYLVDAAGKPFFYHADTAWQLPKKATLAVAEEYFNRLAKAEPGDSSLIRPNLMTTGVQRPPLPPIKPLLRHPPRSLGLPRPGPLLLPDRHNGLSDLVGNQ